MLYTYRTLFVSLPYVDLPGEHNRIRDLSVISLLHF